MTNLSFNPLVKKSKWICPQWLNPKQGGCGMSYHKNLSRWKENTVDIVGRGQEFVAKPKNDKECKKWLVSIFQSADLKENIKGAKKVGLHGLHFTDMQNLQNDLKLLGLIK